MILLSTSDVRRFFKLASVVKASNLMSVLSYVKLSIEGDVATLSKTNLSATVTHRIGASQHDSVEMLIDEKMLSSLCSSTSAQDISVTPKDDMIVLSDGKHKLAFATMTGETYPTIERWQEEGQTCELESEVLSALAIARQYIATEAPGQFSFVHVYGRKEKTEVAAMSGPTMYVHSFEGLSLPNLILSPETCAALGGFTKATHQFNGSNKDLFRAGDTVYSFVRPDCSTPNFGQILDNVQVDGGFVVERADILGYCELTERTTTSQVPFCQMTDTEADFIHLSYDDSALRVSNKQDLPVEKLGEVPPFTFNTKLMAALLRPLPYRQLRFSPALGKAFVITTAEDAGYTGLLMGIIKPANA